MKSRGLLGILFIQSFFSCTLKIEAKFLLMENCYLILNGNNLNFLLYNHLLSTACLHTYTHVAQILKNPMPFYFEKILFHPLPPVFTVNMMLEFERENVVAESETAT